ncbi:MAG: hypothetical protein AAFX06_32900 [Planctomycetota bacterium]
MTISVEEKLPGIQSRDGTSDDNDGVEWEYHIHTEGEDEASVRAAAKAGIPETYQDLIRSNILLVERGPNLWSATAEYEAPSRFTTLPKLSVDQVRWGIRTGGGESVKRTYSDALISETTAGGAAVFSLAGQPEERLMGISSTKDGWEVEGVDWDTGAIEIFVETVKSGAQISAGYLVTLATYAKLRVVNSAIWNGFAIGTLKLVTFNDRHRGGTSGDRDIDMSFSFEPNLTNINVGNGLVVPEKQGHDRLDVQFQSRRSTNGLPTSVPVRVAVHRDRPRVDFATALGI